MRSGVTGVLSSISSRQRKCAKAAGHCQNEQKDHQSAARPTHPRHIEPRYGLYTAMFSVNDLLFCSDYYQVTNCYSFTYLGGMEG